MSNEWLLTIAIYVLFAMDSCWLLYDNEAVILPPTRKHGWRVIIPSGYTRLLGKVLFFSNIFHIGGIAFRGNWQIWRSTVDPLPSTTIPALDHIRKTLTPIRVGAWLAASLLLIVLPVSMLFPIPAWFFLITFLSIYVLVIVMILYIGWHRKTFRLSISQYLLLILQSLIFIPYAINLPRTLSGNIHPLPDALTLGKALLEKEEYNDLLQAVEGKVKEDLHLTNEHQPQYKKLKEYGQLLLGEMK